MYAKIKQDQRHTAVRTLSGGDVACRSFPDWSMGFIAADSARFGQFIGYVNPENSRFLLPRAHNTDPELLQLLQEFVQRQKVTF